MKLSSNVVDAIGNTPLVQLQKVVPSGSARILVKLEFENPTGSMKDRVAKAIVEGAVADGRLSCRVHGWNNRHLSCFGMRGKGLPVAHGVLGRVQRRETAYNAGVRVGDHNSKE